MGSTSQSRRAAAVAVCVFAAALLVRLLNMDTALPAGRAQVPPADDLYHAKRMAFSAAKFPRVLGWDADRGIKGAFCPWPPAYDLAAGGLAALTGGTTPRAVLERVVWLPPLSTALFVALFWVRLRERAGFGPALVASTMLTFSPPLLAASRLSSIDHHYLEPPLLLAIAGAMLALGTVSSRRGVVAKGLLFGAAISGALFVQTALLLGAAVAFVAVVLLDAGAPRRLAAAALGFASAAVVVGTYRLTRPGGYPDSEWFLGAPHAAALAAAAVACGVMAASKSAHVWTRVLLALGAGVATLLAIPGALSSAMGGARFFGGDPWLASIEEFQPIFGADEQHPARTFAFLLGGGALLLVAFAAHAWHSRDRTRRTFALFAVVYVAASLASRRFTIAASPLLAIVTAFVLSDLLNARRRLLSAAAAALAFAPIAVGALPEVRRPSPVVPPRAEPMLRVAHELRERPDGGRVLGPWSWGHLFDVAGGHPVVIDNFGVMPSRLEFEGAVAALLADEPTLARYCARSDVRYVVLDSPFTGIPGALEVLGAPVDPFLRPPAVPDGPYTFTRRSLASFWWRAYYDKGRERPEAGRYGRAFRAFRLVYEDQQPAEAPGPYRGPAAQLWEFVGGSGTSAPPATY